MSTMKNHLRSFLSRLALCGLAVALILLSPALMRADAITTFDVSGTAQNISGGTVDSCAAGATCAFSGMFKVDTTTGTLVSGSYSVTLPGLPTFDSVFLSGPIFADWRIAASNSSGNQVGLNFTTAPTPASLVGFTGGSIVGPTNDLFGNYVIGSGRITPVPEPSSLVLFATSLLVFGLTRRFGKKVGHPLST